MEEPTAATDLASELTRQLVEDGTLARDVLTKVLQAVPGAVGADEEVQALTFEMVNASIDSFATAVEQGIPADEIEAPWLSIKYARRLAWEGVTIDEILRGYRLGHEVVFERLISLAEERGPGNPEVMGFVRRAGEFSFRLVDVLSTEVAARFAAERETIARGTLARRARVVRELLDGKSLDRDEAERTLGYRLTGRHVAALLWRDQTGAHETDPSLDHVAESLAEPLGSGRPLVVYDAPEVLACWFNRVGDAPDWKAVEKMLPPDCRLACGRVGEDVPGFCASRRQAERARTVALAGGPFSGERRRILHYQDVALVSLLIADPAAARVFVEEELGALAGGDETNATLRHTLLVLMRSGGQQEASEELFLHRNTVAQRVRRAEELLGHPLRVRRQETEAALLMSDWLSGGTLGG